MQLLYAAGQVFSLWWPTFQKFLNGLIENGLIPVVMWEANCTSRLEVIGISLL
jgi:hypothetical protein